MASKYLKAAIPTYEPGYVPLPLDFINQKITGDQTKFDTAASQVAALNALNQQVAPWDKGKEQELLGKYTPQIDELSNTLYKTGQVGQVVPQIAKLQQQWQNDAQRKYLQQGFDWYTSSYEPRMKSEGYSTAFDELRDDKGNWRTDVNNYGLGQYSYVESDKDAALEKKLDNLRASTLERITNAGGKTWQDPTTGMWMYQEPGSSTTERLDMNNPYIKDAISNVTEDIMSGEDNAAKWYKGKLKDKDAIAKHVFDLASTRFYSKETIAPGNQGFIPGQGSSGSGSDKPLGDFSVIVNPVPTNTVSGDTYMQINKNIDNLSTQQDVIKNGYQMTSAKILEQFPDLATYVKGNIKQGLDPESAMNEGFQLAVQYAEGLNPNDPNKLAIQGALADMNKQITEYNTIGSKKFVFEQQRQFVDNEVSKRIYSGALKEKLDNFEKPALAQTDEDKHIKGFDELTDTERAKVINIMRDENHGIAGFSKGTLDKLFEIMVKKDDKGNPLIDNVPVIGSPGFNTHVGGLYNILKGSLNNPALYDGIKFDAKSLFVNSDGKVDTKTEQWNDALQNNYKAQSLDLISKGAGFANGDEMIKSAVTFDGKIGPAKNYKFDNIQLLQFGATPTALYTFKSNVDGKPSTVQVVAPLTNINNNKLVQDSAIEMFNKGRTEGDNALASSAAQLLVTSSLGEDEYGKLLFLFKANTTDYKPLTFNIQGTNASVSKVGGGYIVDVAGQKIPVNKEEDVLTILGTSILDNIQTQAFGVSGGGSTGMGKGTTWVPQ